MDSTEENMRAAKLALARKKLKDHQEKKFSSSKIEDSLNDVKIQESLQQEIPKTEGKEHEKYIDNKRSKKGEEIPNNLITNPGSVSDILISDKRNLESQLKELQGSLDRLEAAYNLEVSNHITTKEQVYYLQNELKLVNDRNVVAMEKISQLDYNIKELSTLKTSLADENNNLTEQIEFTKTILTSKKTENANLQSQLKQLQNELEGSKLKLQQLNSGLKPCEANNDSSTASEQNENLISKINSLEQQLKVAQKERDQINSHYEHYVSELNQQLKTIVLKNQELSKEVTNLTIRENNLIEQISDMEIRFQSCQVNIKETCENQNQHSNSDSTDVKDMLEKYTKVQVELQDISKKYMQLQELYDKSEAKIIELQEVISSKSTHDDTDVLKLTAAIASDKIAAQRATEQNKKLKSSIQELEDAFIKMSQDKLELTEKLTAEKFLNRELTIKLAEIEEKSKDMHVKLMAKDEEMIRLQANVRDLENKLLHKSNTRDIPSESIESNQDINDNTSASKEVLEDYDETLLNENTNDSLREQLISYERQSNIPKEDAMLKLQERFMKIMGEVADLSDEKHRLEHIILQLQNETDTICEYVALYQQQRSLLKKRDEERGEQIKLFQVECDRLKTQLEELSGILLKFAEDRELATYFEVESRQKDMEKVRSLLLNLKSNTLVDPQTSLALSNVYPCNCCSGNLIEV